MSEHIDFVSPTQLAEAVRLLGEARRADKRALLLAGGTDFFVERHKAPVTHERVDLVIDLRRVAELRIIEATRRDGEERVVLGGGVTYAQLRSDPRIPPKLDILRSMARDVGAAQIQSRGTLAGNLATASPAADAVPVLMALDGVVRLACESGARDVPLTDFFTGYRKTVVESHEIILSIDVRVPQGGACVMWRKVGTRRAQAISKVALASVIELHDGKIARARFGMASVAPMTHGLTHLQRYLEGRALGSISDHELPRILAQDIAPIDDVRSTREYRAHVAHALVRRALFAK